jgi:hypothetical protein
MTFFPFNLSGPSGVGDECGCGRHFFFCELQTGQTRRDVGARADVGACKWIAVSILGPRISPGAPPMNAQPARPSADCMSHAVNILRDALRSGLYARLLAHLGSTPRVHEAIPGR